MALQLNFGEVILSVLQKERDRKQDQEKLAQTMAFQERQFDLMNTKYLADMNKPFETKSGDIYPTRGGQPQFNMPPLWKMPETESKKSGFTLSPGQTRYDENGNPIASEEPKPEKPNVIESFIQREELKRQAEEKKSQGEYNAIMGIPSVTMEELIKQGLVESTTTDPKTGEVITNPKSRYDEVYVYRDNSGNVKLIFSDEELQSFAEQKVPNAPNKWKRKKSEKKVKPKVKY